MQRTLGEVLDDAARRWPDRAAIVHDGVHVSYAELRAQALRLAAALARLGLRGARVGLLLPNLPSFPPIYHALLAAGATPVMLNPLNSPREVSEHLADADASWVVTLESLAGLVPAEHPMLLADGYPGPIRIRREGAEEELEPGDALVEARPDVDDAAAILFTAADAGRARGAPLSHRNLVANLRSTARGMDLAEGDRVIAALPLVHAFGLTVCMNAPLSMAAAVIPVERFQPLRLLELIERERVTVVCGVPAMYLALIAAAERQGVPSHSLRVTLSGGAPLDPAVARRWEQLFRIPLRQGYGITEAGPVCLFNGLELRNHPGTLGHPLPDVDVSIRDPGGDPVPDGDVGELCVRGENVFRGYLGDGGRRPGVFHGDWLRTGDLASVERDRTVRFRGILKPMFTRNGFNVYPRELERVIGADPRIREARVSALPDPGHENEIVVTVVPAAGSGITEEDVRELCRLQLAAYKQPGRVIIETD